MLNRSAFIVFSLLLLIGCSGNSKNRKVASSVDGRAIDHFMCKLDVDGDVIRTEVSFNGEGFIYRDSVRDIVLDINANSRFAFALITTEYEDGGHVKLMPALARLRDGKPDTIVPMVDELNVLTDEMFVADLRCQKQ